MLSYLLIYIFLTLALVASGQDDELHELNVLLDGTLINLPDTETVQDLGGVWGTVIFSLRNVVCFNLNVKRVGIKHETVSYNRITLATEARGLRIDCDFEWKYDYGITGVGIGALRTLNYVTAESLVRSTNFEYQPPQIVSSEGCRADVGLKGVSLDQTEGFGADFLAETFRSTLERTASDMVQKGLCYLSNDWVKITREVLLRASSALLPYMKEDADSVIHYMDPLSAQLELERKILDGTAPKEDLLNYFNPNDDKITSWLVEGIQFLSTFLSSKHVDPDRGNTSKVANMGSIDHDLGVNLFLRQTFLDSNGRFSLRDIKSSQLEQDGKIIYNSVAKKEDQFFDSIVTLQTVHVDGLDSIIELSPVEFIGAQTMTTYVAWEYIELVILLTIDVSLSQTNPSILNSNDPRVTESVTATFRLEKPSMRGSLFLAAKTEAFSVLTLGHLLNPNIFWGCLASTLYRGDTNGGSTEWDPGFELTELTFVSGKHSVPTITGPDFSNAMKAVLLDFMDACEAMLGDSFDRAIPGFTATTARNQLNGILREYAGSLECVAPTIRNPGKIDFRDLFLSPTEAIEAGASGGMPYGPRSHVLKSDFDASLAYPDAFNAKIVRPLMSFTTGNSSIFHYKDVLTLHSQQPHAKATELAIENVDSFGSPSEFMTPSDKGPFTLSNHLLVGVGKPLRVSGKITIDSPSYTVDGTPMVQSNSLSVSLEMYDVDLTLSTRTTMDAARLILFPLVDAADLNCVLSVLPTVGLNSEGHVANDVDRALVIEYAAINTVRRMELLVECISCPNKGIAELPTLIHQHLERVGVIDDLFLSFLSYFETFLGSDYVQTHFDRLIDRANRLCPHASLYGTKISTYSPPTLPSISESSFDDVLLVVGISTQVALVVVILSIIENSSNDHIHTDLAFLKLSRETEKFLDLAALSDSYKDTVNNFFTEIVEGKMKINDIIKSRFLNENGVYIITPKDISFAMAGVEIIVDFVEVHGLDSISRLDLMHPVDPYTLENLFTLETLRAEVQLTFCHSSPSKSACQKGEQVLRMVLEATDIDVQVSVLLVLDQLAMGNLPLGSILHSDSALSCLLSATRAASVTKLKIDPADLQYVNLLGDISETTSATLRSSAQVLLEFYSTDLIAAFETSLRDVIHDTLARMRLQGCPLYASFHEPIDMINLFHPSYLQRYGNVPSIIMDMVENEFLSPDDFGMPKINGAIPNLISNDDGELHIYDVMYPFRFGDYELQLTSIRATNVDSIGYPLNFWTPIAPQLLRTTLTVGVGKPFRAFANLTVPGEANDDDPSGVVVDNFIEVEMELPNITFDTTFTVFVDERSLMTLPLQHIREAQCWLTVIPPSVTKSRSPTLAVQSFTVTPFEDIIIAMDCISCPSSSVKKMTTLFNIMSNKPGALERSITAFVLGENLQRVIRDVQVDAIEECSHTRWTSNEKDTALPATDSSIMALFFFVAITVLIILISMMRSRIRGLVLYNYQEWIETLTEKQLFGFYYQQMEKERKQQMMNFDARPMFLHPSIPLALRLVLPVLTLGNMLLLYYARTWPAALLSVHGTISGRTIDSSSENYPLSLEAHLVYIWSSGSKGLGLVILFFSVIWPFAKHIATFILWFTPTAFISVQNRGFILKYAESLTKLSVIEILMFLIQILPSFSYSFIRSSNELAESEYFIEVKITPLIGFNAIVWAQIVSHILSHTVNRCHIGIVAYHENESCEVKLEHPEVEFLKFGGSSEKRCNGTVTSQEKSQLSRGACSIDNPHIMDSSVRYALCDHEFRRERFDTNAYASISSGAKLLVTFLSFFSVASLVLGWVLPLSRLKHSGLLSIFWFMKTSSSVTPYGLFHILKILTSYGMVLSIFLLVFSIIIVPVASVAAFLAIWFIPMCRVLRRRILSNLHLVRAWDYTGVLVFTLIVLSHQKGSSLPYDENVCRMMRKAYLSLVYYEVLPLDTNFPQCSQSRFGSVGVTVIMWAIHYAIQAWLTHIITEANKQLEHEHNFDETCIDLTTPSYQTVIDDKIKNSVERLWNGDLIISHFSDKYSFLLQMEDPDSSCYSDENEMSSFDEHGSQEGSQSLLFDGATGVNSSGSTWVTNVEEELILGDNASVAL